ncbi:MAG TPA: hypothetical protein DET40_09055 [Lentisphaeria bacterium]|nr:MAG: hypothetical protein A2X45_07850 [Lentisphaerae bacterium GWF2_50_93]HCE43684.1 hypothetical protein [Lentisphaeria bacterium]
MPEIEASLNDTLKYLAANKDFVLQQERKEWRPLPWNAGTPAGIFPSSLFTSLVVNAARHV